MTAYSRIPNTFPQLDVAEVNTRQLLKSSLIRKLALAQNFLWAHGRIIMANGYEGNGFSISNKDDNKNSEILSDGRIGICVSAFLVPANWNKNNQVKISFRTAIPTSATGVVVAQLENLSGGVISSVNSGTIGSGLVDSSFTIDIPTTGSYQIRVFISNFDFSGIAFSSVQPAGTYSFAILHVSARFLEAPDVDSTWFEFPTDFFSNNYPVASVFLNKLVRNILHLWGTRTPQICQAYLGPTYWNDSSFQELARYVVWLPHKINEIKGKLFVYCTHSGAGNEVRIKLNGTTMQTFTALAAGFQELTVSAYAVTGNAEATITVEAKSTAAGTNWGTQLMGVQVWESGTSVTSPPSNYAPLDFNALEGDDAITAQDLNKFGEVAGLRHLFNNDKWLAEHKLRCLIGDWCHRTVKRGPEITLGGGDYDPRIDWTRGINASVFAGNARGKVFRNITVMGGNEDVDGQGKFPDGLEDAQSGYNPGGVDPGDPMFIYPISLTYNGKGTRLGLCTVDSTPSTFVAVHARARRRVPYLQVNDATGTGPLSADDAYQKRGYLDVISDPGGAGVFNKMIWPILPGVGLNYDDRLPIWLPAMTTDHQTTPYNINIAGRLLSQWEGLSVDGEDPHRPEGMLFEIELHSLHIADVPLTEADLQGLF